MDGAKIILGFLWTIVVIMICAILWNNVSSHTYTGTTVGPVDVSETQIINIQGSSYHLKATSCSPFEIDSNGSPQIAQPEVPTGTDCTTSYYKIEGDFTAPKLIAKSGSESVTLTSPTPVGMMVQYDPGFTSTMQFLIAFLGFWIWFLICVAFAHM